MAMENIDYGSFPNDPNSDSIRIAFEKVQNNFTELYGNLSNIAGNVISITGGNGVTTNSNTGNVIVNATFSSLTVHSDTLSVSGLGGAVPPGGTIGDDYVINNASSTLLIELISNSQVEFSNVTINENLVVNGNTISAPDANLILDNGNLILSNGSMLGNIYSNYGPNLVQFSDANSIIRANSIFTYDETTSTLGVLGGNITTDQFNANYLVNTVNLTVVNDATISNTLSVGNIVTTGTIDAHNVDLVGNLTMIGNISASSLTVSANIVGDHYSGNGNGLSDLNGSNITTGIIPSTVLSGTYPIDITGTADYVSQSLQSNITSLGTLTSLTVSGNTFSGNIATVGLISGVNASLTQSLTAETVTSTVLGSVSGTFSGNVQVGNLQSDGEVFAETMISTISISTNDLTVTNLANITALSVLSNTQTANISVSGLTDTETLSANVITVNTLTASGNITSTQVITNQTQVLGNVLAGNVYANGGIVGGQTAIFTGQISGVNGTYTGTVTANNITSNNSITATSVTSPIFNLSGLTSDPASGTPGDLYYNNTTGKFRGFNGISGQWEDLN